MTTLAIDFELSVTQEEFIFSDAIVNALISNTGEGKTFASIAALPIHAMRCPLPHGSPLRVAIIRDTHQNIKMSIVPSIKETPFAPICKFYDDYKVLKIASKTPVEAHLLGIDDPAALSKLQGPEFGLIWINEPAPIIDRMNAGISEEVFNLALVRCARQKNTIPRLQIDMNPGDKGHWTHRRLIENKYIDPDNPEITKKIWFIPYGENKFVNEISRAAVRAAYANDPSAYTRFVKGEFAPTYVGARVAPQFNKDTHVSNFFLKPAEGLWSFIMWDGWHKPAALLGQITRSNRVVFLDACYTNKVSDIRSLIRNQVMPLLNSPRWKNVEVKGWRHIGDFTMRQPDQSNRSECAAEVVEKTFGCIFESGPARWDVMKHGIGYALNHAVDGRSAVIIDPRLEWLISGLEGKWHYKTDHQGNIMNPKPVKNDYSHLCDAFANGVNVLVPALNFDQFVAAYKAQNKATLQRASSYGGNYNIQRAVGHL